MRKWVRVESKGKWEWESGICCAVKRGVGGVGRWMPQWWRKGCRQGVAGAERDGSKETAAKNGLGKAGGRLGKVNSNE